MMAYYHSCYERQEISHGQKADRGPPKADRVRCADLARAQPALARVQENISGACRGGVPRSVAKVRTAADLKAALRESTKDAVSGRRLSQGGLPGHSRS